MKKLSTFFFRNKDNLRQTEYNIQKIYNLPYCLKYYLHWSIPDSEMEEMC